MSQKQQITRVSVNQYIAWSDELYTYYKGLAYSHNLTRNIPKENVRLIAVTKPVKNRINIAFKGINIYEP